MRKSVLTAISLLTLSTVTHAEAPKNIIYMIGDGMGPAYTTAYRYYVDNPDTKVVESTIFDDLFTGLASTYPDDNTVVTDSAAGATALATATKSYNGAIAVDTDKKPLTSMLHIAKQRGMATGLVATSQINHATPASFVAHNEHRRNYNEIADDYFDEKVGGKFAVDLMLGGGTDYFIRKDRNLVNEFKQNGYHYIDDFSNLGSLERLPALGLFSGVSFAYAIDYKPKRLTKMTEKSLSLLDKGNKDGFFIMLEASQIDWCGHANDIACAMREMDDFAHAIQKAKAYVDANPDTLLVVTADHSTGGLTIGAHGDYAWNANVIKKVKSSGSKIAKALINSQHLLASFKDRTGITLGKEDAETLATLVANARSDENDKEASKDALANFAKQIISKESNTGWTTTGHTAIDVPVLAYGKGADAFYGHMTNTDIAKRLINYIKK